MNRTILKISLACSLLFAVTFTAHASSTPWTPSPPLPLKSSYSEEIVDGLEGKWYGLKSNEFAARWFPGGGWLISDNAPNASLTFYQRVDQGLKMELFLYSPSDVFKDFSKASLEAYASSILGQHKATKIDPEVLVFESPKLGGMPLFGHGYRKLSYRLTFAERPGVERYVCDLISILDDQRILILRYSGSEGFLKAIESDLASELRRFTLE